MDLVADTHKTKTKDRKTFRCPSAANRQDTGSSLMPLRALNVPRLCMWACVCGCQSCKSNTCAAASESRSQKLAHLHPDNLCLLGSKRASSAALAEWVWVSDREKHWLYKRFGANGGILVSNTRRTLLTQANPARGHYS